MAGLRIVLALMPALGTLFEHFVVAFFVFLDQPLQADVTPDFDAAVIRRQQQEEARDLPELPRKGECRGKSRLRAAATRLGRPR